MGHIEYIAELSSKVVKLTAERDEYIRGNQTMFRQLTAEREYAEQLHSHIKELITDAKEGRKEIKDINCYGAGFQDGAIETLQNLLDWMYPIADPRAHYPVVRLRKYTE